MLPDYIIWKMTETEEELRSQLQHPELFADKVSNLKPGSKRMLEVLTVRRALKELFYGVEQQVLYTPDGAPYLAEGPYISISHTMGYAAVITADRPVSIDIERRGTRVQRVIHQFLKDEELFILQLSAGTANLSVDPTIPASSLHPSATGIDPSVSGINPSVSDINPSATGITSQADTQADAQADTQADIFYSLALHLAWSAKETAYKLLGHDYYDLKRLTTVRHIDWASHLLILGVEGREAPLPIHFDYHPDYVLCWAE
jgi:4'-phosphopantetheinyl transferase EntD